MMRSTLSTFTKHTLGRVRRRTSTKQRSIRLVVRSFCCRMGGEGEPRQQLRQVALQLAHHGAVLPVPAFPVAAKRRLLFGAAVGQVEASLHFVVGQTSAPSAERCASCAPNS